MSNDPGKAGRQRRYRQRKAQGLRLYRIALDQWHVRQLLQAGLIDAGALEDETVMETQLAGALEVLIASALDGVPVSNQFWSGFGGPESMAPD